MAKHKRSVWDELMEMGRRFLDDLDEVLNPEKKQSRKPAPVPVPVRNNPRPQPRPYDEH